MIPRCGGKAGQSQSPMVFTRNYYPSCVAGLHTAVRVTIRRAVRHASDQEL